ncbi:MAG: hypothetical protein K2W95_19890 [Candidatus Obscuribacterales bacterium]|nr:hypothetical protein [Candidatus Obscuribacterales bacterium]
MNPELFEDEDVCEDICGGTEDDEYNALEDEACCGDQIPSSPGTGTEQPAQLPNIVLDGANAIGGAIVNALRKPLPDFSNAQDRTSQLRQLGQGALENAGPKPTPNFENEVPGQMHRSKDQKHDLIEQMMREAGNSSESFLRKLQEGNGENTNRTDAQKEAQQMIRDALRSLGIIPRSAPHNIPTPGSTESRPTTNSEKHRR